MIFTMVRFGNVTNSSGSVIPFLDQIRQGGPVTITDQSRSNKIFYDYGPEALNLVLQAEKWQREVMSLF